MKKFTHTHIHTRFASLRAQLPNVKFAGPSPTIGRTITFPFTLYWPTIENRSTFANISNFELFGSRAKPLHKTIAKKCQLVSARSSGRLVHLHNALCIQSAQAVKFDVLEVQVDVHRTGTASDDVHLVDEQRIQPEQVQFTRSIRKRSYERVDCRRDTCRITIFASRQIVR